MVKVAVRHEDPAAGEAVRGETRKNLLYVAPRVDHARLLRLAVSEDRADAAERRDGEVLADEHRANPRRPRKRTFDRLFSSDVALSLAIALASGWLSASDRSLSAGE
eukprot:scaffold123779_cov25-Tisochrysis_lutea.AAC.1